VAASEPQNTDREGDLGAVPSFITPDVELERLLSAGAMGELWLARHHRRGSVVAVKLLAPRLVRYPVLARRFEQEGRAAARVRHPNVIEVMDHGRNAAGRPYIVMELLEGEALADCIARDAPLDVAQVIAIADQLARALEAAHRAQVIHRDVKPANVFLTTRVASSGDDGPHVKLIDFGIASLPGIDPALRLTQPGLLLGTPAYMSPEQVAARHGVDHRSDQWSFAIVVYEMLTNQLPFGGESVAAICARIAAAAPDPPTALRPTLPHAVDAWFARATRTAPIERYTGMHEARLALHDALRLTTASPPP
jgi:serine/threonine-protein kinase